MSEKPDRHKLIQDLYEPDKKEGPVMPKETNPCKMSPPSTKEQQKYFDEVINNYATQNVDLVQHLKRIEDRLAVMEKTAPALMVYNLFKEIRSETDLDFGEYVTQMVAQAELGIKPDLFDISKGVEANMDDVTKTESNDSTTIAQLHQLEALLHEENQVKERIAQMVTLESDTKAAMDILGTPEMAMAFEMQNKFDTGKFGKVNVPMTQASPTMIDKADKLCCTLKTIENCCACKLVKIEGLKSTVEYLSQVMRYAAKHEEDRDKPEIPEAKKAIHDILMHDNISRMSGGNTGPGISGSSPNRPHYYNQQHEPQISQHSSYHSTSSYHGSIHSPGMSILPQPVPIYEIGNDEHPKLRQSYVLDHHTLQYHVDTSTMNPFQQYPNKNHLENVSSTIHLHSIESLLVRDPKKYTNKYNQQYNFNVRTEAKNLQDNDLKKLQSYNPPPNSFLVTSYNNNTLDADYILYKREELSNSIEFKPEFIKLPVAAGNTNFQPHYMTVHNSEVTTMSTALSSKFNIYNTDDLLYSVIIPKTEENELKNFAKSENHIESSQPVSQIDDSSEDKTLKVTSKDSEVNRDEFIDEFQHRLNSNIIGNVEILPKSTSQYSDKDMYGEKLIGDMQSLDEVQIQDQLSQLENSIDEQDLDKKRGKSANKEEAPIEENISKKTPKNKRKKIEENKRESSPEVNKKKRLKSEKDNIKENKIDSLPEIPENKLSNNKVKKNTSTIEEENRKESLPEVSKKRLSNVEVKRGISVGSTENIQRKSLVLQNDQSQQRNENIRQENDAEIEDVTSNESKDSLQTFMDEIVSSFIPTSPSRRSYQEVTSFLDISDTNKPPTDVISIREDHMSQTTLVKHFPFQNLNTIVPEITIKYYLVEKPTEQEPETKVERRDDKVYTKIIKPIGIDLMDKADQFSEVIVKYSVPLPANVLKEHQLQGYITGEQPEMATEKKKEAPCLIQIKDVPKPSIDKGIQSTEPLQNEHLLWFDQFSKIEIPKKQAPDSDFSKLQCTCSNNCNCSAFETQPQIDQCSTCDQLPDKCSNCCESSPDKSEVATNSWFEKNSSLEIAHHSFISNEEPHRCTSKTSKNAHVLTGGHCNQKILLYSDPCKVECNSITKCPKYDYCGNVACTSNFSKIVYDEKSILPAKTPHNSYVKNLMDSRQSKPCCPKSIHEPHGSIKPTKCWKSQIQNQMSLKSKTVCDCKTSYNCDTSLSSNTTPNLTNSSLYPKSKTEVPSTTCQKSNESRVTVKPSTCCKSCNQNSEQKIPTKTITHPKDTIKVPDEKLAHNETICTGKSNTVKPSTCCKSFNQNLETNEKPVNVSSIFLPDSPKSTLHQSNTINTDQKFTNNGTFDSVKPSGCYKSCNQKPQTNEANILPDLSTSSNNMINVPSILLDQTVTLNPSMLCKSFFKSLEPRISSIPSAPPNSPIFYGQKSTNSDEIIVKPTSAINTLKICCETKHVNCLAKTTCQPQTTNSKFSNTSKSIILPSGTESIRSFFNLNVQNLLEQFDICKCRSENPNAKQIVDILKNSLHTFSKKSIPQENTFITNLQSNAIVANMSQKTFHEIWDSIIDNAYNDLTKADLRISIEESNKPSSPHTETKFCEVVQEKESIANADCMRIKNYMVSQIITELDNIDKILLTNQDPTMKIDNKAVENQTDTNNLFSENSVNSFIQTIIGKLKNLSSTLPSKLLLNENSNYQKIDSQNTTENESIILNTADQIIRTPSDKTELSLGHLTNHLDNQTHIETIDNRLSLIETLPNENEVNLNHPTKSVSVGAKKEVSLKHQASIKIGLKHLTSTETIPHKTETVLNKNTISLKPQTNTESVHNKNEINLKHQKHIETVSHKKDINLKHHTTNKTIPNKKEIGLKHPKSIENVPNNKEIILKHKKSIVTVPKKNEIKKNEISLRHQTNIETVPNKKDVNIKHENNTRTVLNETKVVSSEHQISNETVPNKMNVDNTSLEHQYNIASVPSEKIVSVKHQSNMVPTVVGKVVSFEYPTNIETVLHEKKVSFEFETKTISHDNYEHKSNIETDSNDKEINTENLPNQENDNEITNLFTSNSDLYNEQAQNAMSRTDVLDIIDVLQQAVEGYHTNVDDIMTIPSKIALPQLKDNAIVNTTISGLTNSEIVLQVENKSSASTMKSYLSDNLGSKASSKLNVNTNSKISLNKNDTKSTLKSSKKVTPLISSPKSSYYNRIAQSSTEARKPSNQTPTKSDDKHLIAKRVSTTSRTSRREVNAYTTEKKNRTIHRGSRIIQNPDKNLKKIVVEKKPSIKQKESITINQYCLLTNIASFRGSSYNSLPNSQLYPVTMKATQFTQNQMTTNRTKKNSQTHNSFDGLSQISTIRGSYQQEVSGLITYYNRLLQEINDTKMRKKIVRRSQTSLCSVCAKVSEEVSLCSCGSNCS